MVGYKVMCNIYFEAQDGLDYMTHEADGKIYLNHEKAKEQAHKYLDSPLYAGEEFFIEEVEVEDVKN